METLLNMHPGEVLLEEFLKPLNISAYRFSKDIGIPQTRTHRILKHNCLYRLKIKFIFWQFR
jgi:antitoxin HigA-1